MRFLHSSCSASFCSPLSWYRIIAISYGDHQWQQRILSNSKKPTIWYKITFSLLTTQLLSITRCQELQLWIQKPVRLLKTQKRHSPAAAHSTLVEHSLHALSSLGEHRMIKALVGMLVFVINAVYKSWSFPRFYVLETVNRQSLRCVCRLCDDEMENVTTMAACQQPDSQHTLHSPMAHPCYQIDRLNHHVWSHHIAAKL